MKALLLTIFSMAVYAQTTDGGPRRFAVFTIATLPAAATWSGYTVDVSDALIDGSCATGGGVAVARCRSNGTSWVSIGGVSGTVTSVSVTTANGVSGTVATATTTPAITLTLGAIAPSSVAASGTVSGSKLDSTATGLGVTQVTTAGLAIVNTTAAAAAAQQISPAIRWQGAGWKTDVTAASQAVEFRTHVVPVQGAASPTGYLTFQSSINAAAYSDLVVIDNTGKMGLGAGNVAPGYSLDVVGNAVVRNTTGATVAGSVGMLNVYKSAAATGDVLFKIGSTNNNDQFVVKEQTAVSFGLGLVASQINIGSSEAHTTSDSQSSANKTILWDAAGNHTIGASANIVLSPTTSVLVGTATTGNYKFDVATSGSVGTFRVKDQTATTGVTGILFDIGASQTAASTILTINGVQRFSGTNTTGAGTALLGANSPAVTVSAPYTWVRIVTADGSTGFIPVWK